MSQEIIQLGADLENSCRGVLRNDFVRNLRYQCFPVWWWNRCLFGHLFTGDKSARLLQVGSIIPRSTLLLSMDCFKHEQRPSQISSALLGDPLLQALTAGVSLFLAYLGKDLGDFVFCWCGYPD